MAFTRLGTDRGERSGSGAILRVFKLDQRSGSVGPWSREEASEIRGLVCSMEMAPRTPIPRRRVDTCGPGRVGRARYVATSLCIARWRKNIQYKLQFN